MKIYHLQPPSERDIELEEIRFENSINQYRTTLWMISRIKAGHPCFKDFSLSQLEHHAYLQRLEAYHKIPTLWLIELHEMLNEINISILE